MCLFFKKPQITVKEEIKEEEIVMETKPPKVKILLDAGHGNNTSGKKSPWSLKRVEPVLPFEEWAWNREITKRVQKELLARGMDVEILVPEDYDVSLKERVNRINKICQALGKDNVLLISIHSNAAGNGSKWMNAYGWSAYTTKGTTKSDKVAEFLYDAAEKYWNGYKKKIRKDMSDGDRDWEENFYITYHSLCPAVLIENGFYDNPEDCAYLLSDGGKEDITKIITTGILNYYGLES